MVEEWIDADGLVQTDEQTPPGMVETIAVRDKTLAYGEGLTFEELVREAVLYGDLMAARFGETRLTSEQQSLVATYPDYINVVALVTEEDPDTMAVLPVVARLLDDRPRLQLRIFCDERDLAPLGVLLPDVDLGSALEDWDLPLFFLFDDEWELQGQWGPRPTAADARLDAWLTAHPEYDSLADDETPDGQARYAALADELIFELRLWFNSGLTAICLEEWHDMLTGLLGSDEMERDEG